MTFRLSFLALGLVGWLTASTVAADDVQVLARGPVHEAYAEPSEREPKPTPVISKEPPKAIEELPPDQKPEGDNVLWMPGYWSWDDEKKDFLWVSGFWRKAPPGRTWMPGSWRKVADGWQWSGGFWAGAKGQKAELEYLPQPPAPLDGTGPTTPAPSDNHLYVPGTWVYRDARYVWRPGFWCEHEPGWVWNAAHYRWTPGGYVFVDGYWDYPLADRGVLFAPVQIPPAVYADPGYVYTPSYVVREDCLYGAMFCRRGYGSYYFGDYFSPGYANLGFSAWCGGFGLSLSFGSGGGWYDPLFSYYNCGYRNNSWWSVGIFGLYYGRYNGDYVCPPQTLVQQNTVINNITNINNNTNTNNVNMVTPIAGTQHAKKLEKVGQTDRVQQQNVAKATRELGAQRANAEAQLAGRPGTGGKTGGANTVTLNVPERPTPTRPAAKGSDPVAPGTPARPTAASTANPPPAPRPTAIGNVGKPGVGGSATGNLATGAGVPPKGNAKPPLTAKPGTLPQPGGNVASRPNLNPQGGDVTPLPKPGGPAAKPGPGVPSRPSATADLPAPKPAGSENPGRPTAPPVAAKPPVSSPPVSVPKPPVGAPVAPNLQPSISRPTAPPVIQRPSGPVAPPSMPRPGPAPAISRPPAVSRPVAPPSRPSMPARPVGPRKGK